MRRLVAASLLVVAAAGCRTYPPLEPVRLAALETDLGQLLLVGFEGTEAEGNQAVERLLCETRVGGVVLFARNITGDEQAGRLTRALAERARACTGRPLLIAVDAEGGQVMRLGAGLTATLSAGELGESNDFTLTELEARRIGRMLKSAGINWNLAPVVDVGYNPANPVIVGAARSFGANPLLVTAHARAFIQGLHAEGVLTALKHFPGHGSSYGDSHKGFVDVTTTANPEAELAPYRTLITERLADAVMTAHVFNRALDSEFPATLSRATLTGLLRGELGFDGPVVTDDLRMGAIEQRWGLETAAVTALAAGADILLIANDRLPDGGSAARAALATIQQRLVSRGGKGAVAWVRGGGFRAAHDDAGEALGLGLVRRQVVGERHKVARLVAHRRRIQQRDAAATAPLAEHPRDGALTAAAHEECATGDGLAGARQALGGDREVNVRRADYEDAGRRGAGGQRRSRNRRRNRSVSTRLAIRQFGSPLARRVSPSGPTTRRTGSHSASAGSIASASARGSWSTSPRAPVEWSSLKPRSLNATMRSTSGPDSRRSADFRPARGRTAWRVASRGTRSRGRCAANTRWAASGSTYMLNSAVGVMLPGTSTAPPIATMRPIRLTAPASDLSVSARLVSGPSATSVSSRCNRRACSTITLTASGSSGGFSVSGQSGRSPRPSSPW
ncbi:MAG: hypothetical protein AUG87_02170 [Candidatus Rokubacteria bacterium 13_1_20CM_4_70_14]|nr:MAG: hypothetical protein AUG87_02170 [Candidatus Rokubacteria bacterium 13_1_20CM_4_70_14]